LRTVLALQSLRAAPPSPAADDAQLAKHLAEHLAELLAESALGNCTAFERFYDATFALARGTARRLLRADDIDDLLADVYFEAWRNVAHFDITRGSAVAWLLTIVRSRALDLLRRRRSQPSVGGSRDSASPNPFTPEAPTDTNADPAEQLWRQQAGSRLHAALAGLNAAERWVLGLAYFRDLTHPEIAQQTQLPLGTVKSHLLRAQNKLRVALAA
jgi:RNA polymerase sigma-70 factor, ECF subfamily